MPGSSIGQGLTGRMRTYPMIPAREGRCGEQVHQCGTALGTTLPSTCDSLKCSLAVSTCPTLGCAPNSYRARRGQIPSHQRGSSMPGVARKRLPGTTTRLNRLRAGALRHVASTTSPTE